MEEFIHFGAGGGVEWVVIDGGESAWDASVVCTGVEVGDFEVGLEEVDGGDEGGPLDTVFVKLVGVAARHTKHASFGVSKLLSLAD